MATANRGPARTRLTNSDNAVLLIELNATNAGNGLVLGAGSDGSSIRGLVINRFSGTGILVQSNGNTIAGNFIGTNAAGNVGLSATIAFGIGIDGSFRNTIGGTAPAARNVIGENSDGINLNTGSQNTVIQGNFIGLGADGTTAVGNRLHGVALRGNGGLGVQNNLIGVRTAFAGNILALASITLNTNATLANGRALARTEAVTLDTNVVDSTIPSQNNTSEFSAAQQIPVPSVTLSISPASIAEAVGTSTVTATLSLVSNLDVTVALAFTGSATITDGTSLYVVNDTLLIDKVFKYTLAGSLVGSWTITGSGGAPTGITLDSAAPSHLWIVDNNTDRVEQYDNAASRISGSQAASTSFALAAGNTNPQGIADPPPLSSGTVEAAAHNAALMSLMEELDWLTPSQRKRRR